MEPIKFENGDFIVTAETAQKVSALVRRALQSENLHDHVMLAQTILGPIKKVADYHEWTAGVLQRSTRNLGDVIRVAIDSPTVIGFYTSPDGGVNFVRPGRKYATVELNMFNVGIELGWYDAEVAGWDILAQKIKEAGEELARKRDEIRQDVIDTAVAAVSGHTSTVASSMSKASVDAIFEDAASSGFRIVQVRINTGRIMDMTDWTWPSNSMWNRLGPERAEEVIRNGFVTGYGGAEWRAFTSVPTNYVYFFGEPQYIGWEFPVSGAPQRRVQSDIKNGVDYYRYDDFLGAYAIGNAVWRLEIT